MMTDDLSDFEAAAQEWDNVQEIVPRFSSEIADHYHEKSHGSHPGETPLVTPEEFVQNFQETIIILDSDPEEFQSLSDRVTAMVAFTCSCMSAWLDACLEKEKKLVWAISRQPFDDQNPLHYPVLMTIYKQLTGARLDCPRYGSHWEQIGFQGNDLATDLRGVGCLGLVHPLYLAMTPELHPLAKDIYKLSVNENQNFPLLVLSINVTRIALHCLRDGLLDRMIILESSVWSAFNFFYVAVMFHIYKIWKTEHKTIKDSGYVLKDAEKFCRKNVRTVIANLNRHLVTAYSINEKQLARQNIQSRIRQLSSDDL